MAKDNLKPFPRDAAQPEQRAAVEAGVPRLLQQTATATPSPSSSSSSATRTCTPGKPTYHNHTTLLTELHDWSVYFGRAFSYTNRRFHPENAIFLPKGERYEEENVCLIHRHENLPATLGYLQRQDEELAHPLEVEIVALRPALIAGG